MPTHSKLGYTGAWQDPITGAYPLGNGYRVYAPALMRFASPDSLSPFDGGGINPYTYCADDPINLIDPSGHMAFKGLRNFFRGLTRRATRDTEQDASIAARNAATDAANATLEGNSSRARNNGARTPGRQAGGEAADNSGAQSSLSPTMIPRIHISLADGSLQGYSSIRLSGYSTDGNEVSLANPIPLAEGGTTVAKLAGSPMGLHIGGKMGDGMRGDYHRISLDFEMAPFITQLSPRSMRVHVDFMTLSRASSNKTTFRINQILVEGDEHAIPILQTRFDSNEAPFTWRRGRHFDMSFAITGVIPPPNNDNLRLIAQQYTKTNINR
jgi:RHS repeat-associated protein